MKKVNLEHLQFHPWSPGGLFMVQKMVLSSLMPAFQKLRGILIMYVVEYGTPPNFRPQILNFT